ncbi:hypothetical protein SLEP1_g19720 [Rubroshorea leprosula]|uniref:Uncharacterized protein n=1 Tax=Rubroshorea leprosula TaxID=152421 RepID=A0AAV5J9J5_9ROSI|nr:hypothetical protein SLEP1_g19720 [Rubroshorea leprosula]
MIPTETTHRVLPEEIGGKAPFITKAYASISMRNFCR